ncbi:HU family DNA-binding protein [Denitratisoma oestradiolicum]|uniref:DNA-binding protein Bph2 n=1 Tax=Denitratisoma oestradiolicum TaxID=311182 RepID=A0A6S6XUZ2_9PROT|nr:HU family DNA-binding protein [Denitratisoma oestradiolicum]TWO78712.1 DNA-binding protein [Denitratisoma oestradiolicum]CAB1369852.1 DNA-binding protein Bph2 [Denitratisoma oestradiolicum]
MATKKPAAKPAAKPAKKPAAKAPAKKVVAKPATKAAPAAVKPIKTAFNKTTLTAFLAETSGVEAKEVKKVMAALEAAALASVNKKGLGEFLLPGLLKVVAQKVPAKPKRKGINPFTKEEQWFAAKPATVKLRIRPLKKLKDAAL